ncbi:MAG: MFS transporter [Coriobacteriales bacterium]
MQESKGGSAKQVSQSYAWVVLVVIYFASIVAAATQFKVTTLSSWLIPEFNMDLATFGWLMSSLTIVGVVLAFPAAWINDKIGVKATIIVSCVCLAVGDVIGAVTSSTAILLTSRAIEGCGIGLLGVIAPTAISVWFPEEKRALPLAIWCTWFPVGTVIMLLAAPALAGAFGWRSVWWVCFVAALLAIVLMAIFYHERQQAESEVQEPEQKSGTIREGFKYLKNKELWLLCVSFFCFSAVCNGVFMSYYPTFMEQMMGFTPAEGGFATSVMAIIGIILMPFLGMVYDRTGKRKIFVIISFAACLVGFAVGFQSWSVALVWTCIIIFGAAGSFIGSGMRPMCPEVIEKRTSSALGIAMGMGVMQIASNLGPTVVTPAFGAIVESSSWVAASYFLCIPLGILAIVCLAFVKVK